MPYSSFRYIGYQVPTVSAAPNAQPASFASGWPAGNPAPPVARIPVPDDLALSDDAMVRLTRLAWVVDHAFDNVSAMKDSPDTLKVFVAPEFYFRPPRIAEDYNGNTYPVLESAKIFKALSAMFRSETLKDWLIVCGTVLYNSLVDVKGETFYFNTAIAVRGGPGDYNVHRVDKYVPSDIDGIPVVTVAGLTRGGGPGADQKINRLFNTFPSLKHRIWAVDNVRLGLEICLDHQWSSTDDRFRMLRRAFVQWPSVEPTVSPVVDLHILTCGGQEVNPMSVCAKPDDGYVLRCDGAADNVHPQVEMFNVDSYDVPAGSARTPSNPDARALTTPVHGARQVPIPPQGQQPQPPAPYPPMDQMLHIFPARSL